MMLYCLNKSLIFEIRKEIYGITWEKKFLKKVKYSDQVGDKFFQKTGIMIELSCEYVCVKCLAL